MGYGFGIFLAALGLILIYALEVDIPGVGQEALGWILVVAGLVIVVITAVQMNARRSSATVARTTHADGSQTLQERSTDRQDPPAVL
jgi:FtsH-binding integral membrane protein